MAVGLVVGGWFASAAISKLADAIRSYIGSQYEYLRADIKGKLKSLEANMTKVGAAMQAADQRHIENPQLKEWLLELKDACYEAEDVIDMFEYQLLEGKANRKNQVSRFSKHACAIVKHFMFRDEELNELLEVVDRFEKLVENLQGLFPSLITSMPPHDVKVDEIMQSRGTTSVPVESQLFGRDKERILLKGLLLQTDDDDDDDARREHVHFVSIVGTGGVGKTSLAQDVYNDPILIKHFDLRAWVCVSNNFNVERLVKEVIDSASISKPDDFQKLKNFDRIATTLKSGLMGKRFLIILDDIWDEPPKKWEVLLSILNSGKKGSRVVITTRNQKIADVIKAESVTLESLQSDDYWNLFTNCAFSGESSRNYPALMFVGEQIVRKLRGNPLAAKTVGAVLNQNLEVGRWREILESTLWEVDQINVKIMPVLRLSYDYLPAHLKPCFVYSSLFPKDYEFNEDELVRLWIAQGFIQPLRSKSMEETGMIYLHELLIRCFFQRTVSYGRYVIHDLFHDLAEYLFDYELLRVEDCHPEMNVSERIRHAYIHADNLALLCKNEHAKKYLRSLVVCDPCDVSLDVLGELKGIRVLIFLNLHARLSSKSFGQMLHLRYLRIAKTEDATYNITKSITKLYHLQVLDVPSSVIFPKGIDRLICLRHLCQVATNISGIGRLTSLQELEFLARKSENGYEIGQLRDLLQVRSLCIRHLGSVESKKEASTAELDNKKYLKILKLCWRWGSHGTNHDEILEGLKPHQSLEHLGIYSYGGRSPSWLNGNWLSNLSSIELWECTSWDILPPLGQLLFLRTLHLYGMGAVKKIGVEFYGKGCRGSSRTCFPSLESLIVARLLELEEWCSNIEGLQLFPCLSYLQVNNCPKLRGPLYVPSPLTTLSVWITSRGDDIRLEGVKKPHLRVSCPSVSRIQEWIPCQKLASVQDMSILYCENKMELDRATFPTEFVEWFHHLTSLQSLSIEGCENLHSLPSIPAKKLRKLSVRSCPAVCRLPEEGLPSLLMELAIDGCLLLEEGCRKDGPDWHKVAHVPKITINGVDIQMQ